MYGYRDSCIRTAYSNQIFYCPYSMYPLHCPFYDGYRPKAEEIQLQFQPPKTPPPTNTPKLSDLPNPNLTTVEFGAISPCIFKLTYLWLKNDESFWSHIIRVGNTSISAWRYQNEKWVPFNLDLKEIKNFTCS